MIFEAHTPAPLIAPFIESVFHFKDLVPDHSIERVVPTGHLFILFELYCVFAWCLKHPTSQN